MIWFTYMGRVFHKCPDTDSSGYASWLRYYVLFVGQKFYDAPKQKCYEEFYLLDISFYAFNQRFNCF